MEKKFNEIVFKTGGTTSDGKGVVKTFENLKRECLDINEELKFENGLKFITTTTDEHLFGFTFFRMLPDVCGFDRYEARINYPEDINIDNAVLVTTPSFLEAMRKFNAKPAVNPKVIIAAGARLEDTTFEYALTIAERVIEIYGSTETGVIAYRTSPYEKGLRIFKGIKIVETADSYTTIETAYSKVSPVIIQDRIKSLKDMLEELFTFTKLKNASFQLELSKCCINQMVKDTIFSYYDEWMEKEIQPHISITDTLLYMKGNEQAIRRVLQNIIKNGLDHGEKEVDISLQEMEQKIVIEIKNKVYHPENIDITQVFTQFYKADMARSKTSSGLGLSIAKEFVLQMQGEISARIEEEKFCVCIQFDKI